MDKKAIISVPDIAKIGSRTFWLGIAALIAVTAGFIFAAIKFGVQLIDKDTVGLYFNTVKDILVIILVGKYVAGKEKPDVGKG